MRQRVCQQGRVLWRRCVWRRVRRRRVRRRRVRRRQRDRSRRRGKRLSRGSRERAKYPFATHCAASDAHLAAHRLLATHGPASKTLFAAHRFLAARLVAAAALLVAANLRFAASRGTHRSAGGTAQVWRKLATRAATGAAR